MPPPAKALTADGALSTSIRQQHVYVNNLEHPVVAAAYSTASDELLLTDGRVLRLFSGVREVRSAAISSPSGDALTPVQALYFNARERHYVAVHTCRHARIVSADLAMHDAGEVDTTHSSITASGWLERRQELVTCGSDGRIRFFRVVRKTSTTVEGRVLLSTFSAVSRCPTSSSAAT